MIEFLLGIVVGFGMEWVRQRYLDINRLKEVTNNFLDIELVDDKSFEDRQKFYNAIVKQFSGHREQLKTFGYDRFLSKESLEKIDSILKNVEDKYAAGDGQKAAQIREYCQNERGELKKLLQRDINLPFRLWLYKKIKG